MKPNDQQIIEAVARLSVLAVFPGDDHARKEIMRLIDRMVATVEQLDWLIETMIDRVGEWKGTKEMRGILCTRFRPLDGVEADSSIRGFTPADSESQTLIQHQRAKALPSKTPNDFDVHSLAKQKRLV